MGADRHENEPEEYDPEAEFRDPDSDSLTIPQVETENAGSDLRSDLKSEFEDDEISPEFSTGDADVDGDLLKQFWALVLVLNAAILAVALGLLFIVFEGAVTLGTGLVAIGVVLAGFGARRYRNFQREGDTDERTDDIDSSSVETQAAGGSSDTLPGSSDTAAERPGDAADDAEQRNESTPDTDSDPGRESDAGE